MNNEKFKNRKVDKVPIQKGKDYLWKYMKSKYKLDGEKVERRGFGFGFKLSMAGVLAGALILLLVFAPNINILQQTGIFGSRTVHASFEMTANAEDSAGVEADGSFTLKSSEDYSEDLIAENLLVSPDLEFEVNRIGEGEYEIDPLGDLEANQIYNFTILSTIEDEETGEVSTEEYSWAYQVKDSFKVTGTLPANMSTGVPVDTGIEFYFSHENYDFDKFEDYFEISPSVDGEFSYHHRAIAFAPRGGLKEGTIYTVTLKKGLKLLGSDQELMEDIEFKFETKGESSGGYVTNFNRDSYEAKEGGAVALAGYFYSNQNSGGESGVPKVDIYKFSTEEAYLGAMRERQEIPSWAYVATRNFRVDTRSLEHVGEFEAAYEQVNWQRFIYLPSASLKKGYYVVELDADNPYPGSQAFLQITNLSSFINVTESDTLVWVNDLSTGKPVAGATVELMNTGQKYSSDNEGIASFETPEYMKEESIEHGSEILKISSDDGDSYIQALETNRYTDAISNYWFSFSTDRPMYLPDDTIHFWGFIQAKDSADEPDDLKLVLEKGWAGTVVDELDLDLDDDTFSGSFELNNILPEAYYLVLYNGDKVLSRNFLQVNEYIKPAYQISMEPDRTAIFAGETVDMDVKTEFFDGTAVPNVELQYYDHASDSNKTVETDMEGEASFTVRPKAYDCTGNYCYNRTSQYYYLSPSLAEESEINDSAVITIFNSHVDLSAKTEVNDNIATLDVETHWIDLDNEEENFLGAPAKDREVQGEITKITWNRVEDGEEYDFISKKVVKQYSYKKKEEFLFNFTLNTKDSGTAEYKFKIEPGSYYRVKMYSTDDQGNKSHTSRMVYGASSRSSEYDYYNTRILNYDENQDDLVRFVPGDEVNIAMANGELPLPEDTEGKFLFYGMQNGLKDYSIEDSPYYSFDFDDEDIPNLILYSVWFDGDKYVTTYGSSIFYDKEVKRLNIEVDTDKESYGPGDYVDMTVKVTDQDGRPVSANMNVSLVDEAYYKLVYDYLDDPLDDIYSSVASGELYDYSSHETIANSDMGAEGGGCFAEGTQISMADGSTKTIEDIKKGDYVVTKESAMSSEMVSAEVVNTVSHYVNEYLVVNDELKVTREHVMLVNGKWDTAGDLRVGDLLMGEDGEQIEVFSVKAVNSPVWVYNFEVDEQHTYFAEGYYVHNDKGGDGVRNDFEDNALFETLKTGANGYGELSFQLPDNISSWRVVARGIEGDDLKAGMEVSSIPVTLPFFTDLVMNTQYSVKDSPIVKIRSFGDALSSGDMVSYVVEASSLGLEHSDSIEAMAFESAYFELPELSEGRHEILLRGKSGDLSDAMSETIDVKGSRLSENIIESSISLMAGDTVKRSSDGYTEISFLDGGIRANYYDLLSLFCSCGDRLDQAVSEEVASELLQEYFDEYWPSSGRFEALDYQTDSGGLKLITFGESDLKLSALITYVETDNSRYDETALKNYFYGYYTDPESNMEEIVLSLLGLANLNEPVLNSLRQINENDDLSIQEKTYIALAFESLGSKNEALAIFKENNLGEADDEPDTMALAAVLASALNLQDKAEEIWEDTLFEGIEDNILNIYRIGFAKHRLKNSSPRAVKFSYKIAGETKDVDLSGWGAHRLLLAPGDDIEILRVVGDLDAVSFYSKSVSPSEFVGNDSLSISRTYYVDGAKTNHFEEGDLVEVELNASFDGSLDLKRFMIKDILPSGLRPVTKLDRFFGKGGIGHSYPYKVNGQEVYFYWFYGVDYQSPSLKYYARVVNPGEFYAEPAKVEAYLNPELANISDSDTVVIDIVE